MKTLYLLRHAKSSWDDARLADFDRPLNGRGRAAATSIARHLAETGVSPSLVICSPAVRTRETLDILRLKMVIGEVRFDERVYESPRDRLLAVLREVPEQADSVMLIGHNPGLERLAAHLVGEGDALLLDRMADKFPTCTLATLRPIDGVGLTARAFRLDGFLRPADIASVSE